MTAREFSTPVVLAVAFEQPTLAGERQSEIAELMSFLIGEDCFDSNDFLVIANICARELHKQLSDSLIEAAWELEENEDARCYTLRMCSMLGETISVLPIGESIE